MPLCGKRWLSVVKDRLSCVSPDAPYERARRSGGARWRRTRDQQPGAPSSYAKPELRPGPSSASIFIAGPPTKTLLAFSLVAQASFDVVQDDVEAPSRFVQVCHGWQFYSVDQSVTHAA